MREAVRILLALALGVLIGLLLDYRPRTGQPTYQESRAGYVQLNASIAGQQDTVVLGDSIMESTWTDGACGRTFNAGTAGAKAEDVRQIARKILPQLKPSIIIVSVGANHFWLGDGGLPEFRDQYRKLIADLPEARLILIGVPNSNAATAYVKDLAGEIGARFLPAAKGSMPDGVHLTPSDASRLRERIERACASRTDGQTKAVS